MEVVIFILLLLITFLIIVIYQDLEKILDNTFEIGKFLHRLEKREIKRERKGKK